MKKYFIFFSLAIAALVFINPGCKKGENDPFISLKSRTARLANSWTLSYYEAEETYTTGSNTYTTDISYFLDDETMTIVEKPDNYSTTYQYKETIEFTKEGTYKQTITKNSKTKTYEGVWYWACKNKELDTKNKEVLVMKVTKYTNYNGDVETYDGIGADVAYDVYGITNENMFWNLDESISDGSNEDVTTGYCIYRRTDKL